LRFSKAFSGKAFPALDAGGFQFASTKRVKIKLPTFFIKLARRLQRGIQRVL
jgi:hypothetical protein